MLFVFEVFEIKFHLRVLIIVENVNMTKLFPNVKGFRRDILRLALHDFYELLWHYLLNFDFQKWSSDAPILGFNLKELLLVDVCELGHVLAIGSQHVEHLRECLEVPVDKHSVVQLLERDLAVECLAQQRARKLCQQLSFDGPLLQPLDVHFDQVRRFGTHFQSRLFHLFKSFYL